MSDILHLSDDAFLRQLPEVVRGAERVWAQTLVHCTDSAVANIKTLNRLLELCGENIGKFSSEEMAILMTHAWAIVDAAHVARQLLISLHQENQDAVSSFILTSDVARKMRNRMDHIHQNAGNFSKAKHMPPIYGALTYFLMPHKKSGPGDGTEIICNGGMAIISPGETPQGGRLSLKMPDFSAAQSIIYNLKLDAFGESLLLDDIVRSQVTAVMDFSERAGVTIRRQAEEHSQATGIAIERIMAHGPSGITIFFGFGRVKGEERSVP